MRIYFIRHGHPNYKLDCLTEIGHLQAAACAKHLKNKGIQKIFSSPQGRAKETAAYTAKELGLPVETLEFARELRWHSKTEEPIYMDGHPWRIADDMVLKGENLLDENWPESNRFSSSVISEHVKRVTDGLDAWLKTFGYEREGNFYRVVGDNTAQTVAMFGHAGASSAALSHLLNAALPWILQLRLEFTSITRIDLETEKGSLTFPKLMLLNDADHLEEIDSELFFGN